LFTTPIANIKSKNLSIQEWRVDSKTIDKLASTIPLDEENNKHASAAALAVQMMQTSSMQIPQI